MTAALAIFHIPPVFTVVIVSIVMMLMVLQGKYWTWEKIAIIFAALNVIYIPAAFLVHPSVGEVLSVGLVPHFPGGFNGTLFFFLMANIGTTIAPWMIFFQQSAVVDKGMKEKDIPWGQMDTLIGSAFTVLVAIFLIVVTGTVLYGMEVGSAAQAASIMMSTNFWLGTFIAIGLFNAGFLGAICISLASSWAFGEVFGWAHSLNLKIREAPWFYVCYLFALVTAGGVVLLPNAPLVLITLFVQVIAVTLLPAALVFLILLLNNEEVMGKYRNTSFQNLAGTVIVVVIIVLSTLYGITTLFPELLS
jgi:Mn2+/Fe2+ NRAMP family transporter